MPAGKLVAVPSDQIAPSGAVHLLIVDDDPRVRAMLVRYLAGEGFRLSEAGDGAAMRASLARTEVDLVLLDLVLPGEDGLTLAREIRAANPGTGIVMITGRDDVIDRVAGLEVGADDYIAKPFHLREVLARVRSVLRRRQPQSSAGVTVEPTGDMLRFEGWRIEPGKRRVVGPDGAEVPLTTGEFDLLLVFASHAGRVLERDRLLDLVKGREWAAYERSIDQQVARLRRKIEADPANPTLIRSVRGVGYLFAAEVRRG
jgi:two-component system, OmpR family, response regulator